MEVNAQSTPPQWLILFDKAVKLQCGQSSPRKAFINHNSITNLPYLLTNPNLQQQVVDVTAQPENAKHVHHVL